MSLKAKIEAVIYASEEPVTLQQLVGLLGQEAQAELDAADALQGQLALLETDPVVLVEVEAGDPEALNAETLGTEVFAAVVPDDEDQEIASGEDGGSAGEPTPPQDGSEAESQVLEAGPE